MTALDPGDFAHDDEQRHADRSGPETPAVIEASLTILNLCSAAAPAVVNGGHFVGCSLAADHDGDHETTIRWTR